MPPARRLRPATVALLAALLTGCGNVAQYPVSAGTGPDPVLPPPNPSLIPTVEIAPARGWTAGAQPSPAPGLRLTRFAHGLEHPRWLYVLPNGDVLVAETNAPPKPRGPSTLKEWIAGLVMKRAGAGVPSADRIRILRDADGDGVAEINQPFLEEGLKSPFGMQLVDGHLYVANTDAVVRFAYREGALRIDAEPEPVVALPAGPINYHWTKNLRASPDGRRLYVTVGSNSNIAEHGLAAEGMDGPGPQRAAIHEIDLATKAMRPYATGLRNPNGLDHEPHTGAMWTVVNERDELGSDLVPDYLTRVVDGGFYGWPYSYFGQHVDERVRPQRPELVAKALRPDYALGPHVAPLGLAFARGDALPAGLREGAFIGEHGSWNRRPPSGYKVVFVPFANGVPSGQPVDVLTGFLDGDGNAQGRPVGVAIDRRGALLVADDVGNTVWRLAADGHSRK